LRIQPLLLFVCLISFFVLGPLVTSLNKLEYFKNPATWTYFRNVFPATGIQFTLPGVFTNNIGEAGVNGSLWTLVVEERLYLLVGLFFIIKKNVRKYFTTFVVFLNLLYLLHKTFFIRYCF
jgi:peptidoglycan/LPS O-acetylase OafA/YrhL